MGGLVFSAIFRLIEKIEKKTQNHRSNNLLPVQQKSLSNARERVCVLYSIYHITTIYNLVNTLFGVIFTTFRI